MKLLEFDNRYFYVNLDKVMDFICDATRAERSVERTTTKVFQSEAEEDPIQNQVSETEKSINDVTSSMRFTFLKDLLEFLLSDSVEMNGEVSETKSIDDFNFRQIVSFNTLVKYGILVEINNNEEDE